MGNFADGFFVGSMLDNSKAWQRRALEAEDEVEKLSEKVEKLSSELKIERKRVFVERRTRRDYMRGWALRGDIMRELVKDGRLTTEEWDEKAERINHEKDAEYLKMRDEADRKIEQEVRNI